MGAWLVAALLVSAGAFFLLTPDQQPEPGPGSSGSSRPDGPGTTEPGILLVVAPTADATFDVTELVRLPAPTSSIAVQSPDLSAAGSMFTDEKPYASEVRIKAGDQSPQVLDGLVNRAQIVSLDAPTRRYELRYELNRAVVRSLPSTSGRALGAVRALTHRLPDDLDVAVMAVGGAVRNMSCPGLALSQQACATGKRPLLRLKQALPWRNAVVVVQLDLPEPP